MSEEMQKIEEVAKTVDMMDRKMNIQGNQVNIMTENVTKIFFLLKGDQELNPESKGIIAEFNEMKKLVAKHEKIRERFIWFALGAGPTSVGIFELIRRLVTKI